MDPALVATLVALLAVSVLAVAALLVLRTSRRRTAQTLAEARAEIAALTARVDALGTGAATGRSVPSQRGAAGSEQFVITTLSEVPATPSAAGVAAAPGTAEAPARLSGSEFAAVAVGESAVRVLTLAHGLRRALSPRTLHRIRYEVRREVKRSRRQRRSELRRARAHLREQRLPGRTVLDEDAA